MLGGSTVRPTRASSPTDTGAGAHDPDGSRARRAIRGRRAAGAARSARPRAPASSCRSPAVSPAPAMRASDGDRRRRSRRPPPPSPRRRRARSSAGGVSTYQSTSTTPGVGSKMSLTCPGDLEAPLRDRGRRPRRPASAAPAAPAAPRRPGSARRAFAATGSERVAHALGDRVALLATAPPSARRFTCRSARFGAAAQEVVPHEAVEVVGRRRARRSSGRSSTAGCFSASRASPRRRAPSPRAACPRACRR